MVWTWDDRTLFCCYCEQMLEATVNELFHYVVEKVLDRNIFSFLAWTCCLLLLPHIERFLQKLVDQRHTNRHLNFTIYLLLFSNQLVTSEVACKYLTELVDFIFVIGFGLFGFGYVIYVDFILILPIFDNCFTRDFFLAFFVFGSLFTFSEKARLLYKSMNLQIQNL